MTKVIWNLGGLTNFNHGDGTLRAATTKIIRERCGEDIRFVNIDTQKTFFSEQLIRKMNCEADMILIGGGGFIFHRPSDSSHSGWQFNIKTEDVSKIKIPLAVYGIGNNKFPKDKDAFTSGMWENIQTVIDKSFVFSVRNNGTKESMRDAGLNVDKIQVVPDSAVFANAHQFDHPCLNNDKLKIGLNFATDRWMTRFEDDDMALKILCATLEVCKEKAQKHNAKIYLIEHLLNDHANKDSKLLIRNKTKSILGEDGYVLFDEVGDILYPSFEYNSEMFVDVYRQMDLVVGMRGHANIIPFGQNTPCIGIGEHNKVKWFLEDANLSDLYVPCNLDQNTNTRILSETIDNVIANIDVYKYNMKLTKDKLADIKDKFVDKILEKL